MEAVARIEEVGQGALAEVLRNSTAMTRIQETDLVKTGPLSYPALT